MERLREVAYVVVGRAVGFATLAIICVMVGLAFDPLMATRAGGYLTLLLLVILVFCAWRAPLVPYKSTELWLNLEKNERPHAGHAQWASGTVMRDAYLRFAQYTAGCACLLWSTALALSVFA